MHHYYSTLVHMHEQDQQRLKTFLSWTFGLSVGLSIGQAAAALLLHEAPYVRGALCGALMALVACLARVLARRDVRPAALLTGYCLTALSLALAVIYPVAAGSLLFLPLVSVALVLPFVRGLPLHAFVAVSMAAITGLTGRTIWDTTPEIPDAVCSVLQTFAVIGSALLVLILLSQSTGRLRAALERSVQANVDLELARTGERAAQGRLRFLADASALLPSSLDYETTLEHAGELVLPRLGDFCAVDMVEPNGDLRRMSTTALEPRAREQLAGLIGHRFTPEAARRAREAIAARRTQVHRLAGTLPELHDDAHLEVIAALRPSTIVNVPFRSGDQVSGLLVLGCLDGRCSYDEHDLALAEELARRLGTALEHARLYQGAQEAVRVRDDFMTIASHELRTPLTSLLLAVQTAERNLAKLANLELDPLARKLHMMHRQTVRLVSLVGRLLDVTPRVPGPRDAGGRQAVDLGEVVRDAITASREQQDLHLERCEVRCHSDGPVLGFWDRLQIEQVVANLLGNALKYGDGKPIDVTVTAHGDQATLQVTDRGIGIDPEDQARIFDRFERAVSARNYGGFGVGLYIVRQHVQSMGGTVEVESRLGAGASFTVTLPRDLDFEHEPAPVAHSLLS